MTTKTEWDLQEIAETLATRVTTQLGGRTFETAETPTEILSVHFAPPAEGQSAAAYRDAVVEPVATALAASLAPWTASVALTDVIGAAACVRVEERGLALRLTESRQWDERTNPTPGRVELRAEIGVA